MGVPKFFRWLSERYPAISQLIADNRIPEFDCLYLDMNQIIHNCTHKDSDSPTFRMTEDKMFIAIFNYIEHLFSKIKPQKMFFMAIDGVAPRAKMNQQRARRFRTALDNEKAREKAVKQGLEMPKEEPFDSNCITPGTEFMANLTQQLRYFINKKVSEDVDWQQVEIVLSGHEVPGEGEHKITEYIRQAKAQPNYDPNVRHCLYGLDADLIMLGLLSHDPHFCLLREEVTFGRQTSKKSKELEHQNFYLMHLCMVREYLELEFQDLKSESTLDFSFDMERIIDDFILMAFFVGNDFLPNLPNLHINEGALALMFKKYKEILPKLKGYINESGVINLERLGVLLDGLSEFEQRFFEAEYQDEKWIQSKKGGSAFIPELEEGRTPSSVTTSQKKLLQQVKSYASTASRSHTREQKPLDLSPQLPARDRKFVQQLALDLHLDWKTAENATGDRFIRLQFPANKMNEENSDVEDEEDEGQIALLRVMKRYDRLKVEDTTGEEAQYALQQKYDQKFEQWKDRYYREKFSWGLDNEDGLRELTETYVQGLQWVLFYYYRGVVSWPWFYKYHYAPMISDVKRGLEADMNFQLGQPFRPYQQLMGVLPDRSKKIVPKAYHELMTSPDSPIIDFYPRDFDLDMNGKKMEWEAVVKIPFIDEKRLLSAMARRDHLLTAEESQRNTFGVSLKFTYAPELDFTYPSSFVDVFPDLPHCHCVENVFELPTMDGLEAYVGLTEGVKLGEAALAGFPSLKELPHTGTLGFHSVNVFQQDSRNESMIISLQNTEQNATTEAAKQLINRRVHVGYPFIHEAKVVKVSDELFDHTLPETGLKHINTVNHTPAEIQDFQRKAERIEKYYSKRLGILIGDVQSLIHVEMLKGLRKLDDGSTVKEFATLPGVETVHPTQIVVESVISEDQRFLEQAALPIQDEFPEGANGFFLGEYAYGRPLTVTGHENDKINCLISTTAGHEVEFGRQIAWNAERLSPYIPSFAVAKDLQLNPLALSKITSSFSIRVDDSRVNLGLNLKFEAKKLKVLGYSRRGSTGWEFSRAAVDLIRQYMIKFPEFIAAVHNQPQGDMLDAIAYFPGDPAEAKARVQEIQAWLKETNTSNFERVPLEAEQLDSTIVQQIEQAADQAVQSEPPASLRTMNALPRNALLKPSDAVHRLGSQSFMLGDRVIHTADSGKVPIATKGTIVGMTQTHRESWLDIVFDVSFMSGTTLGGRCSPFRGSTSPTWSVLNLSNRQILVMSKASASRQSSSRSHILKNSGYGPPGIHGESQFVDAPAPPKLTGSWRNAVNGQSSSNSVGGSGGSTSRRGSYQGPAAKGDRGLGVRGQHPAGMSSEPNSFRNERNRRGKGGYTNIFRGDQGDGSIQPSPNFKPQQHHYVPPPSSLGNFPSSHRRGSHQVERGDWHAGRGGRGRRRGG